MVFSSDWLSRLFGLSCSLPLWNLAGGLESGPRAAAWGKEQDRDQEQAHATKAGTSRRNGQVFACPFG